MRLDLHVRRFDRAAGRGGIARGLGASASGDDPAAWLESTFGPCMAAWGSIEPRRR